MGCRVRRSFTIPLSALMLLAALSSDIATAQASRPVNWVPRTYCGIYCMYAAARALGKPLPIERLLRPEYVSSPQGSSAEDLCRAAQENGLYAEPVEGLTTDSLRECPYPVILHVKASFRSISCDHWILYHGSVGGLARLFDPSGSFHVMEYSELLPRWDGKGILVSTGPIDSRSVLWRARWSMGTKVLGVGIVLGGLMYLRMVGLRRHRLGGPRFPTVFLRISGSIVQFVAICGVAGACAWLYHRVGEAGFASHMTAIESIREANAAAFLPKVSVARARWWLASDAIFVDARAPDEFARGHIPRAVNIPAGVPLSEYDAVLAGISRDRPLVVYCERAGCSLAKQVATVLVARGYTRVNLFVGGWEAWSRAAREDARAGPGVAK